MYVVIYLISIKSVDDVFLVTCADALLRSYRKLVRTRLFRALFVTDWKRIVFRIWICESVSKNIFLFHWPGLKFTVTFLTKTLLFIPMVPDITGGLTRSRISLSKTRNKNLTKGSSCALDRFTMLFVNRVSRFPSVLRLGEDVTRPSIWWQVFINLWICRS